MILARGIPMFWEKIFGTSSSKKNVQNNNMNQADNKSSAPTMQYVQTLANRQPINDPDNMYIVLSWISKKKKGYDITTNKFPKWFMEKYGIDFNNVAEMFLQQGLLSKTENIVKITDLGNEQLKKYSYVIYVHEHPQYWLSLDDFRNVIELGSRQNTDIAWGIFNQRIIEYTQRKMWSSLASNYSNMADLLIEEERYEYALDFIFTSAYIETSGMRDGNELTPIFSEFTKQGYKMLFLPNGMPHIFLMEINNYGVTVPFLNAQSKLNLDWDDIRSRFINSGNIKNLESVLPFRYFEKEESFEFFKAAVEAGGKKGVFRLESVKKKLKTNMPNPNSRTYFYASVENKVGLRLSKK